MGILPGVITPGYHILRPFRANTLTIKLETTYEKIPYHKVYQFYH